MTVSIAKFAPTAIVFAAVGYCCWPYLDDKRPNLAAAEAKKLPEIARGQLTPVIVRATGRDPFGNTVAPKALSEAATGSEPNKKGKEVAIVQEKDKTVVAEKPGDVVKSGTETAAAQSAEASQPGSVAPTVVEPEIIKIDTSELTLNATFLIGAQRFAIINNKQYGEGSPLDRTDSSPKPPTIARVLQHKVVLERQGVSADLFYAHVSPKTEVASAAATTPTPAARAAAPTTPVAQSKPKKAKYVNPAFANPKPKAK